METNTRPVVIREEDTLREVLHAYPQTLRVIMKRWIPVSCASGSIAEAARACDLPVEVLVAELREAASEDTSRTGWHEGTRRSRSNRHIGRLG